ncbi:hypothetical protein AMTRI_Chr02g259430 [Amborella trichopoda]
MKIKKKLLVIKTKTHELRKKFFRLKRRQTQLQSQVLAIPFLELEWGVHPRPVKKGAARYGRKRGGGIEEVKISQTK